MFSKDDEPGVLRIGWIFFLQIVPSKILKGGVHIYNSIFTYAALRRGG